MANETNTNLMSDELAEVAVNALKEAEAFANEPTYTAKEVLLAMTSQYFREFYEGIFVDYLEDADVHVSDEQILARLEKELRRGKTIGAIARR